MIVTENVVGYIVSMFLEQTRNPMGRFKSVVLPNIQQVTHSHGDPIGRPRDDEGLDHGYQGIQQNGTRLRIGAKL